MAAERRFDDALHFGAATAAFQIAGYAKRFGVVRVDDETHRRTVKASGWEYANVIAARSPDHTAATVRA
jgi:beta-glucosidase/6-phospho-beta-glucosidase/beta-galactosidase